LLLEVLGLHSQINIYISSFINNGIKTSVEEERKKKKNHVPFDSLFTFPVAHGQLGFGQQW